MSRQFSQQRRAENEEQTVTRHAELQERAQQGATAAHLMDFAESVVLPDQETSIRKRVFALIDDPEKSLGSDIAVQAWIELRAAHKLVERLRKIKTGGEAANLKLSSSPLKT